MKKKILIIVGTVVILSIIGLALIHTKLKEYQRVAELTVTVIDLATINDGIYEGSFAYAGRKIAVKIAVRNDSICKVEILEKDNSSYTTLAAKQIPDLILEKQNNSIDAISGATTSSKAILKAVENALMQAN